jgi:predicted enzyme related to lactoylglutathione lyase
MRILITALLFWLAAPVHAQLSPPNAAGVTYGHMHLTVTEIEVHKKLFVDVFGGTLVQRGNRSLIKFPNMLIAFRQGTPSGPSQGSSVDHFGFRVRDINETSAALRAAGCEVHEQFTGVEGFPNAYVSAPDGLRLELQEDKTLTVKAVPNHVHFFTADYKALLDWYIDTFSLTKRNRGKMPTTADAGTVNLSFGNAAKPVVGTRGRSIDHIGFEVKNLEAFVKQLEARGVKIDQPVRQVPALGELKFAFITDPAGTYIELTEGLTTY